MIFGWWRRAHGTIHQCVCIVVSKIENICLNLHRAIVTWIQVELCSLFLLLVELLCCMVCWFSNKMWISFLDMCPFFSDEYIWFYQSKYTECAFHSTDFVRIFCFLFTMNIVTTWTINQFWWTQFARKFAKTRVPSAFILFIGIGVAYALVVSVCACVLCMLKLSQNLCKKKNCVKLSDFCISI